MGQGQYPLGSTGYLFRFSRALALAQLHIFSSSDVFMHTEQNHTGLSVAFNPWCKTNSGLMLFDRGTLPYSCSDFLQ